MEVLKLNFNTYVFILCEVFINPDRCLLPATDVFLRSLTVSSVTSVRFVIGHVKRAGLDKALLGILGIFVYVHPTVHQYFLL